MAEETNEKKATNKPTHWAYRMGGIGDDGDAFHINIGAAWEHEDGTLTVIFDTIPAEGLVHLEPRLVFDDHLVH